MMTNYELEGRSRVWKDSVPRPTDLKRLQDENLIRMCVKTVIGDHIILNSGVDDIVDSSKAVKTVIRDHIILNSGVDDIIDLSKATCMEAHKARDHIFLLSLGKYKTVPAIVESVIRTNNRDKIILRIQKEKTWRIAFSLCGVTLPRDEEPYADEAFELLRQTIVHKRVEILLETIDEDGYFVGSLLESNTHVAMPLLEAGLAKLLKYGTRLPINHLTKLFRVEKSAITKKLKIWENHI